MDNGRIRMRPFKTAMICEVYSSDEITLSDIEWVLKGLRELCTPPFRIITIKLGDYWVSEEAQKRVFRFDDEVSKVAYVANEQPIRRHALNAQNTYLKNVEVFIRGSIESAYDAIAE